MIITKTPYRISFFGGGSDYPQWYLKNGGEVISTTIDKYIYLSCRSLPPFFNHKYRIVWSKVELVKNINEIQHHVVKHMLSHLKLKKGLENSYRTLVEVIAKLSGNGLREKFLRMQEKNENKKYW